MPHSFTLYTPLISQYLFRLNKAGVHMTTVESCVMELMQTAKHPKFKLIAGLLKEHNSLPNGFSKNAKF